ncbi:DUF3817 domain-containing protein [Nocardioides jiangxiensis]|uniref:DUF3817 domain-containing protein n=1 Tax=Nocardioides jiangxiensis TaxID=3064524 RepID=A0ABT9AZN1_9ACTN|nr:DUF3817 domain-containing protein [Nocardioides sp. WY-20]MDO7867907.1 DUF3817 domain-containing protein [Nocardioides sp. WY-20]
MSPLRAFRVAAIAEAVSWTGLLVGMFFKYVVVKDEIGVQVMGPIHGVAFIAFVMVTLRVGLDARWSKKQLGLGLLSSIPPLFTVVFDLYAEKAGLLADSWNDSSDDAEPVQG